MDFVFESVTSRALGLQSIGGTEVDANPSEQGVKRLVREAVPRLELRRIHAVEVVAPGKRVLVHMVGSALLRGERVDHRRDQRLVLVVLAALVPALLEERAVTVAVTVAHLKTKRCCKIDM